MRHVKATVTTRRIASNPEVIRIRRKETVPHSSIPVHAAPADCRCHVTVPVEVAETKWPIDETSQIPKEATMIWIMDFPLPPSVNEYLEPHIHSYRDTPNGGLKIKSWQRKTDAHVEYENACNMWAIMHAKFVKEVRDALNESSNSMKSSNIPVSFRVDSWFCFHESRIYCKDGSVKELDANNRVKPFLDALVRIFGIDDRHFFAGNCEKITTPHKENECSIARITPFKPRTLQEIITLSGRTSPAF
jgi:hypothetical protein